MRVKVSEDFRVAYKRLKKRHISLQQDFENLLASLLENPVQGVELDGGVRKIRLAITSKGLSDDLKYGDGEEKSGNSWTDAL